MLTLHKRVTEKVASGDHGFLTVLAKSSQITSNEMAFAIMIQEMGEDHPEKVKRMLGDELFIDLNTNL